MKTLTHFRNQLARSYGHLSWAKVKNKVRRSELDVSDLVAFCDEANWLFYEKEIERLNQHYNIDKLDKAFEDYANNWFDMHDTNHYKALKEGFEAGSKWQINQISPAIKACELEIERLKADREWISVKDRLPIKTGLYLTYSLKYGVLAELYEFKEDRFLSLGKITHWMLLPEPPK